MPCQSRSISNVFSAISSRLSGPSRQVEKPCREQTCFALSNSGWAPCPRPCASFFLLSRSPAVRRPGRPAGNSAREDFGLEDLDKHYTTLLRQFQSEDRSRSTREKTSPSERAYRELATEMKDVFGNIDWLSLRNKHSSWKTGRFHPADSVVDLEDFDAEIEQQFPAHK